MHDRPRPRIRLLRETPDSERLSLRARLDVESALYIVAVVVWMLALGFLAAWVLG